MKTFFARLRHPFTAYTDNDKDDEGRGYSHKYPPLLTDQGLILIGIAALVTAITAANSYTTQTSTAYFREASAYEALRLANIQVTHVAQYEASKALAIATVETGRSQKFEQERDEAAVYAKVFFQTAQEVGEEFACAKEYIRQLEKTLSDHNIAVPGPELSAE